MKYDKSRANLKKHSGFDMQNRIFVVKVGIAYPNAP